nr:12540_t:CDS:1 [Entrophospora candida]
MTITVKSISDEYGAIGPVRRNDFKDIIDNTEFGGGANIKQIYINRIAEIKIGNLIDSIQFSYSVVTNDGISHIYQGAKWGEGLGGAPNEPVDFTADEQIIKISGTLVIAGGRQVVRSLSFQTSQRTLDYGSKVVGDTEFSFPPGVIFGSNDDVLFSIGVYEIAEAEQSVNTVTSTITETTEQLAKTVTSTITETTQQLANTVTSTITETMAVPANTVTLTITETTEQLAKTVTSTITETTEQLAKTVTSTIIETMTESAKIVTPATTLITNIAATNNSATEIVFVDNPRIILGLSIPLALLSILLLATFYYKYKKKDTPLRVAGGQPA